MVFIGAGQPREERKANMGAEGRAGGPCAWGGRILSHTHRDRHPARGGQGALRPLVGDCLCQPRSNQIAVVPLRKRKRADDCGVLFDPWGIMAAVGTYCCC